MSETAQRVASASRRFENGEKMNDMAAIKQGICGGASPSLAAWRQCRGGIGA